MTACTRCSAATCASQLGALVIAFLCAGALLRRQYAKQRHANGDQRVVQLGRRLRACVKALA